MNVMGGNLEVRHASLSYCETTENRRFALASCFYLCFRPVRCYEPCFLQPLCLPTLLPSIFCYSKEGALRFSNPFVPFLFLWLFLLIYCLKLPLLLPRPHVKQLGTFFLYLSTLPAKIELFG